ncbi:hypothetical protein Lsed01_00907 [Demequina sediminis]|uniref:Uncharacterized protein n=1 Tax=Demequina sediminis TaxID=1930058 RepID=A0ABP9WFB5_9MICO
MQPRPSHREAGRFATVQDTRWPLAGATGLWRGDDAGVGGPG